MHLHVHVPRTVQPYVMAKHKPLTPVQCCGLPAGQGLQARSAGSTYLPAGHTSQRSAPTPGV